jgi:hypothetical protein
MAGFMRLPLQRIVRQGLKKLADIQGGPVFWGSGLEKFHCNLSAKRSTLKPCNSKTSPINQNFRNFLILLQSRN